jgi:hypothetical protein
VILCDVIKGDWPSLAHVTKWLGRLVIEQPEIEAAVNRIRAQRKRPING